MWSAGMRAAAPDNPFDALRPTDRRTVMQHAAIRASCGTSDAQADRGRRIHTHTTDDTVQPTAIRWPCIHWSTFTTVDAAVLSTCRTRKLTHAHKGMQVSMHLHACKHTQACEHTKPHIHSIAAPAVASATRLSSYMMYRRPASATQLSYDPRPCRSSQCVLPSARTRWTSRRPPLRCSARRAGGVSAYPTPALTLRRCSQRRACAQRLVAAWHGVPAQSRCDVGGASPVPVRMWEG